MAQQRIDPFYIDVNLVTSTDIQANVTDYIDLINKFPDETTINNMYWHTDSHSDPITSKIDFFKKINSGELEVSGVFTGDTKKDTSPSEMVNKNYRDQLPDNMQLKTTTNGKYGDAKLIGDDTVETYKTTTVRQWVSNSDESKDTEDNGQWSIDVVNTDSNFNVTPVLDIQKELPERKSVIGMKDMGVWFIMWWIEKFNCAHNKIKADLIDTLGENNEYFVKFSESVGQLKNISDTYDTATLPIWDYPVNAYGSKYSIPEITPGVGKYCMKGESVAFCQQLSKNTNQIFRENMMLIMEDPSRDDLITGPMPSFSNTSHGNNYVNDNLHSVRITQFTETVHGVLQDHLKGLYDILDLLSNKENYMIADKPKQILMKVESFTVAVDLLKNKIKSYDIEKANVTTTRYGKQTRYNNNVSNTDRLAIEGIIEQPTKS